MKYLVIELGFNLLEDSKLRDIISNTLFMFGYSEGLTVRSAFQSRRSAYNAAQLVERVDTLASIRNDFPEEFRKICDNAKKFRDNVKKEEALKK